MPAKTKLEVKRQRQGKHALNNRQCSCTTTLPHSNVTSLAFPRHPLYSRLPCRRRGASVQHSVEIRGSLVRHVWRQKLGCPHSTCACACQNPSRIRLPRERYSVVFTATQHRTQTAQTSPSKMSGRRPRSPEKELDGFPSPDLDEAEIYQEKDQVVCAAAAWHRHAVLIKRLLETHFPVYVAVFLQK